MAIDQLVSILLLGTPTKTHSKPPLVSKAAVVTSTPQVINTSLVTVVKTQPTAATKVDDDSSSVYYNNSVSYLYNITGL